MSDIVIHIDHLVLRDVPPAWAEGLGVEVERAVAAAARADSVGPGEVRAQSRERRVPASDQAAFAIDVGRQIWSSVKGDVR